MNEQENNRLNLYLTCKYIIHIVYVISPTHGAIVRKTEKIIKDSIQVIIHSCNFNIQISLKEKKKPNFMP